MRTARICIVLALVLAPASAWAGIGFVNPPEDHWPYEGPPLHNPWVTPFPYQRLINFSWGMGRDEAPAYLGPDDPILYPSDYVEISPNFQWFEDDSIIHGEAVHYGVLIIDNRLGTSPTSGTVKFHIDNWEVPRQWKHVWDEVVFELGPNSFFGQSCLVPDGHSIVAMDPVITSGENGDLLQDWAIKITPNPPWEEIILHFDVAAGSYAILDNFMIATECVPEPATVSLLALGLGAALWRRRRK